MDFSDRLLGCDVFFKLESLSSVIEIDILGNSVSFEYFIEDIVEKELPNEVEYDPELLDESKISDDSSVIE